MKMCLMFLQTAVLILIGLSCSGVQKVAGGVCPGCVDLDDLNFNKTLKRFPYALIKFDSPYPYGEKHEIFAEFSKSAHAATDDLLVGTVGIKDYGNYDNKALADYYNISSFEYPVVVLFSNVNGTSFIKLPDTVNFTLDSLKKFVTLNTDLYIGCEGCLKLFNELIKNFINLKPADQSECLKEADRIIQTLKKDEDKESAHLYKLYMKKISEVQSNYIDFITDELKRIQRIAAARISSNKKIEFTKKMNILKSFLGGTNATNEHNTLQNDEF